MPRVSTHQPGDVRLEEVLQELVAHVHHALEAGLAGERLEGEDGGREVLLLLHRARAAVMCVCVCVCSGFVVVGWRTGGCKRGLGVSLLSLSGI